MSIFNRAFKYEFRKSLTTLIILSAIAILYYGAIISSSKFLTNSYTSAGWQQSPATTNIGNVIAVMAIYCVVVPCLMFSYRMTGRSVDAMYSLPIKRSKLFIVKSLVGLVLVFVPFTLAYWFGFLITTAKPNMFHLTAYIPAYLTSLYLGICFYAFNIFAYNQASNRIDGVLFILIYAFLFYFIGNFFLIFSKNEFSLSTNVGLMTFGSIIENGNKMDRLIRGTGLSIYSVSAITYIFPPIIAILGYGYSLFSMSFDKAENSESISEGYLGYRALLPIYAICITAITPIKNGFIGVIFEFIGLFVAYIIYKRKINIGPKNWLILFCSVMFGIIMSLTFN